MEGFRFPENFALGVASAATQIDGDCQNSNWYDWYQKGHIKDGSNPDITTLHRQTTAEDTALMAGMGIRHYRFGLEWARIEPQEGQFCTQEFEKVRQEIVLLQQSGIQVLLTLHHFSNPIWFEEKGGFANPDCVKIFLRLVGKVVENLGDLVNEYITINEPNVYAVGGFFGGGFPPDKNSMVLTLRVLDHLAECHRRAYRLIHTIREKMGFNDTKVGFAHHMRVFAPLNQKNPIHTACCALSKQMFQQRVSRAFLLGSGRSKGCWADFLAVNYYSRTASRGLEDGTFPGVPLNDLGWEIYPAGIAECCRELHALLPDLPIYITENGTADNTDRFRRRFLYDHLKVLCESGLPVTRYYHWCFVDNFEWLEGFSARFGLVELNTATQQRTVKKSGEFYSRMILNHGVTQEMADEIEKEAYPV